MHIASAVRCEWFMFMRLCRLYVTAPSIEQFLEIVDCSPTPSGHPRKRHLWFRKALYHLTSTGIAKPHETLEKSCTQDLLGSTANAVNINFIKILLYSKSKETLKKIHTIYFVSFRSITFRCDIHPPTFNPNLETFVIFTFWNSHDIFFYFCFMNLTESNRGDLSSFLTDLTRKSAWWHIWRIWWLWSNICWIFGELVLHELFANKSDLLERMASPKW